MKIFESTKIPLLSKALNAYSRRQDIISSNIANITTPGYHAQRIVFEEQLASAMDTTTMRGVQTQENHIPIGTSSLADATPQVVDSSETSGGDPLASGVNNVDIDTEMSEMAKNQIRFRFASRLISETFKGIQKSIRGQS